MIINADVIQQKTNTDSSVAEHARNHNLEEKQLVLFTATVPRVDK